MAASPWEVTPLLIGSKIPASMLKTAEGNQFDLNFAISKNPAVVFFYCGEWCPRCKTQLEEIGKNEERLNDLGYKVILISPDSPESLRTTISKYNLKSILLSDGGMSVSRGFGVSYTVDETMLRQLREMKIDIEAASGEKHHQLPVPSVFVIGTDGIVKFQHANPDFRTRVNFDVLFAAAKAECK